jgi:hypothetical protein
MTENPYSTPTTTSALQSDGRAVGEFKPLGRLTSVLKVFYYLHVSLAAVGMAITGYGMTLSAEDFDGGDNDSTINTYLVTVGIYLAVAALLYVATVIAHCIWTFRAAHNTRVLGATGHEHSVGWSVGWFFIPIANLIMPYKVAREIHKSSTPKQAGDRWKGLANPSFIGWWWGAYILTGMLTRAARRLVVSDDPGTAFFGECLDMASSVTLVCAAVLAVRYITEVCEMQGSQT